MIDLPDDRSPAGSSMVVRRARWLLQGASDGSLAVRRQDRSEAIAVTAEPLGSLELPDGRVVAADPYTMEVEKGELVQRVPSGEWDVIAAVAQVGEDHTRVAAALLVRPHGDPIVSWTLAHTADADVDGLEDDEFAGYPVDAGTGCFADPETAAAVVAMVEADGHALDDPVTRALEASAYQAVVAVPTGAERPVAMFSSGWGDGVYPTYAGRDAGGEVVVLMTDFLLHVDDVDEGREQAD